MMTRTHEYHIPAVDFERDARRTAIVFLGFMAALGGAMLTWSLREPAAATASVAMNGGVVTSFGPIVSHRGQIRGEVIAYPASIAIDRTQRWTVLLESGAGAPVANAIVRVRVSMPEMGTRMVTPAVARNLGDGRYEISGLAFTRPGWWNVALTVVSTAGVDSLAFNLTVPEQGR